MLMQRVEERAIGHAIIEGLVIAILVGMTLRTLWAPPAQFREGIAFAAKQLLEFAVLLLGASVNLPELMKAGPALLVGIVLVVVIGLSSGIAIGRALGLSHYQYGVLAGMTVYAVPQVIAATFPVSGLAGEVGTLVKLVRVLMLGPVVIFFSLRAPRAGDGGRRVELTKLVPWFIVGFVVLALLRSVGVLPTSVALPVREVSRWLTVVALAALGLGVDVRAVGLAGVRVSLVVTLSLLLLLALSIALILLLGIR